MNTQQRDFLKIISAALTKQPPDFQGYQLAEDWKRLYKISSEQKLSPMIYDQLYCLPAFQKAPASLQQKWMGEALAAAGKQVVQAESFASVCDQLAGQGIRYAVLKGISCKVWYPKPELRPSGDEDILIDLKDAAKCDEILRALHYDCEEEFFQINLKETRELHYIARDMSLYLEVHLNAIGQENERNRKLNALFEHALEHTEEVQFEGRSFSVLEPTLQMIQVFSHFYRHFYEQGAGIRQMLDILLGLQKIGDRIDWKTFRTFLKDLKAEKLFAAMLNTGIDYFHMDLGMVPEEFIQKKVRPEMMLDDMFAGGIYGHGEDQERKLSGFLAMEVDTGKNRWMEILFPSPVKLQDRYPRLHTKPYLYPYFIIRRWFELFLEYGSGREKRKLLKKRLDIAEERRKVLKYYR